ncbi:hypothetical protein Ae201684P_011751 [Aphanomyces euteiches]|uniref:Uncharacterized protein n=1 Tax=Aphanomyces euteiches TaxID=100861 RepID=A0A6G0WUR2_9STRA|nr:hypothetical protein Ae201684_011465 [Aphanomyces euteiches]KAH9097021.1 hypothetical protein Ae201684P_011751 [Aphanomyces euteiches]
MLAVDPNAVDLAALSRAKHVFHGVLRSMDEGWAGWELPSRPTPGGFTSRANARQWRSHVACIRVIPATGWTPRQNPRWSFLAAHPNHSCNGLEESGVFTVLIVVLNRTFESNLQARQRQEGDQ